MNTSQRQYNKLLLIDDEPGIRKMMTLDLTSEGYEVYAAEDGAEGLNIFAKQKPDIVITDLKMPGVDGIEVLRKVKERSPDTEVIVITGHGDLELAIESLRLNAGDFITKPIHPDALEVALNRAQERMELKAELASYTRDLEQRVMEATARVVAAERLAAVGQTVSSLVHSIKNMLSGLKGGTYLVKEGLESDSRKVIQGGVEMLERNVKRVSALVYDLLTLAKPRQPLLKPVQAGDLIKEALDCMSPEAEHKGVELLAKPFTEELILKVDEKAIRDCLNNLISNAIDSASTVTGGRVNIGVRKGRQEMAFEISDNGPGLDEDAEEHIFDGFFSSKGASGTGLGLMVTEKIAREHGGRVDYDNYPGEGATFWLVLPLKDAKRPDWSRDFW